MTTIKPAKPGDILVINELAHRIWPVTYENILSADQLEYMLELLYRPSCIKKQMEDLQHTFVIIYEDDIPAGFASYSIKAKSRDVYKLHKFYILQSQQGKGIGKFVLNKIIGDITLVGAKILELNVNRRNPALNFYERTGFKIIGQEDIDIGNGYFMNDYVMQKTW